MWESCEAFILCIIMTIHLKSRYFFFKFCYHSPILKIIVHICDKNPKFSNKNEKNDWNLGSNWKYVEKYLRKIIRT